MTSHAGAIVCFLLAGCASAAEPSRPPARPGAHGLAPGVIARVGQNEIQSSEVQALAASNTITPALALRHLEEEALLASAAHGFARDRETLRVGKQASVQALLAREVEARVPPSAVEYAEVQRRFESNLSRFERPERRASVHLLVRGDVEGAEAWVRALVERLARSANPLADLRAAEAGPGPARVIEDVPPLARSAHADPAYLEALFAAPGPGLVPRPVASAFGWHAVVVTEIEPRWEESRDEALRTLRQERLTELRAAELEGLIARLRAMTSVEVDERALRGRGPVTRAERSTARESPRDQNESSFTPILRALLYRTTGVLAVAFVDDEGECVDYCSALPPYDAKVVSAHMRVIIDTVGGGLAKQGAGETFFLHVHGELRDFVARRISNEYVLVMVIKPHALTRRLLSGIEIAVSELRREAGIPMAVWEPLTDSVRVDVRKAVGWSYAPSAYYDADRRIAIQDVLGRWIEGAARARLCFRVRSEDGEEVTLVHYRALDRWELLREADDETER